MFFASVASISCQNSNFAACKAENSTNSSAADACACEEQPSEKDDKNLSNSSANAVESKTSSVR